MTAAFPPEPRRPQEVDLLLGALGCVVPERAGIYVSLPITTGKRFADWHRQGATGPDASHPGYAAEHVRTVVEPNRAAARPFVQELRRLFRQPLIDPTALPDLPGWAQEDYRTLWARVIERYAAQAIFADGWQFSSGCAYEFLVAQRSGAVVLDQQLRPLPAVVGAALLRAAVEELRAARLSTDFLEQVLSHLA